MLEDDEGYVDEDDEGHAEPAPIEKFHRTPVGMVFAAGLLGLQEALAPVKKEDPPHVHEWGGQPTDDDPVLVELDFDNPGASVVRLRPWATKDAPETTE